MSERLLDELSGIGKVISGAGLPLGKVTYRIAVYQIYQGNMPTLHRVHLEISPPISTEQRGTLTLLMNDGRKLNFLIVTDHSIRVSGGIYE